MALSKKALDSLDADFREMAFRLFGCTPEEMFGVDESSCDTAQAVCGAVDVDADGRPVEDA